MNQGGKHAAAEQGRVENKRERRRGAAGRAAVLRRAPSDSDCSGETASLSADSGDRAPRPAPLAPPRSGKTRSRRRGSEWEVLEGLKDGQRFEKRPDVFNGYLHKKRKWPLKGWHKRFFVVDGGILVYARSPTDVARGRLHGSVDVGLSVISAKARRRRIDIDADEFIYHLRAKTPDVFRTWLNVLKAHRLYRQHLLTFGARESVPKIHPPLEDLPPTDTSSHTSFTSNCSTETSNLDDTNHDTPNNKTLNIPLDIDPSEYSQKHHSSILDWQRDVQSNNSLIPLNFESLEEKMFDLKPDDNLYHNKSLCSMKCVARRYTEELKRRKSPNISLNTTDAEKQMGSTDLDFNSLKTIKKFDASIDKTRFPYKANMPNITSVPIRSIDTKVNIALACQNDIPDRKRSPFMNSSKKPPTTCFFFTRKRNKIVNSNDNDNSPMKKSKKCTNLVKYKNLSDEPPLINQSSKCMLLGKYKLTATKHVDTNKTKHKTVACDPICKENNEAQVTMINTENKASQIVSTIVDYDKIAEKLMISIFRRSGGNRSKDVKFCINQVVQDLYDIKVDQEIHPVRALFKNLLEYWMKTTSVSQFRQAMTTEKSVDKQSINYFTRDENLSSLLVEMKTKETQFCGRTEVSAPFNSTIQNNRVRQKDKCEMKIPVEMVSKPKAGSESSGKERCVIKEHSKVTVKYKSNRNSKCEPKIPTEMYLSPRRDTESFEKEKRIQELERLLRSTVYMCETERTNINKEKDIKITKKLIDNLGKGSQNNCFSTYDEKPVIQKSSSSAELPEIQDTINHLISETCIPPDVAKEFLGAYLDVLLQDRSKSTTSLSSDWDKQSQDIPECEVIAEAVIKKVSKSMTTLNILNDTRKENLPVQPTKNATEKQIDPGQVYLKDILDKVTTIFSRVSKIEDGKAKQESKLNNSLTYNKNIRKPIIQDELGRPVFKYKSDLIYENSDENSLVIDLSKYHLEHISMDSDPAVKDMMSITIKLKEKPPNHGESKQTHLSLKFPDDVKQIVSNVDKSDNWLPFRNPNSSASADIFRKLPLNKLTCLDFEAKRDKADPFLSNSDGTSKAFDPRDKSHNSLDDSPINAMMDQKENEDLQSCYIMSIKKGSLSSKFQSKKKGNLKPCDCDAIVIKSREHSPNKSSSKRSDELSVFERPAPRIIDEKFILLLLENLTFLSRNVPTLHKDINALYLKLKKKHEKIVKNCNNMQGLSLLGKIYSEDSGSKDGDDRGTQYDPKENQEYCKAQKKTKNASTNTTISKGEEKCECAFKFLAPIFHVEVQTSKEINDAMLSPMPNNENTKQNHLNANLNVTKEVPESSTSNRERMVVTETETIDIDTTSQSTSNPNWFKTLTIDVAMNTQETKTLEQSSSSDPPATAPKQIKLERELKKMRNSSKVKRDLFKEIPLLGPLFKVSTQSQTERQFIRFGAGKRPNRDFHIYQLYLSKKYELKQSSSMIITSKLDHQISDEIKTLYRCSSDPSNCSGLLSPTTPTLRGPQAGFVSGTPGGRLAGWIIESGGPLENASRELGQAQLSVQQLQRLLDALELQQQVHHDTDVSLEGASPNVKKDRRKFGLRKKKSSSKCASVELAPPHIDLSSSHTALSSLSTLTAPPSPGGGPGSMPNCAASLPIACAAARPQSLPGAESLNTAPGPASLTSLTPDHQLREDFTVLAKDLVASLKGIVSSLVCERGRLRAALEAAESTATPGGAVMAALRTNLTSALQQNSELRSRLSRIHDVSDIAEIMSAANSEAVNRQFQQSLSYSSSCVSASEFFDAEEHEEDDLKPDDVIAADEAGVIELDGDSSSEAGSLSSEEGSASSDNSEAAMLSAEPRAPRAGAGWARRTRLPAPRPSPGGPSLWNLLYKNIGKDLSQISMPVTINEPLNMLQRLCEELEYSELLDAASACSNAVERMCLVAAFAVSAYAGSAHRAASKPFNPLLGETYECVRDDRSFRFIAEQVSHHPPISACHAESPRWSFWQEARIKTKFWGKSMEFQPTGQVHVRLATTGDHYTWNKVTTCVHNLFGGQRWVDQYGDMHVVCRGTDISAKLNFIKASSWSQSRHEVRGAVQAAGARVRVAGRWSEALYAGEPPAARCLWRPGAMPPEHELYYGFTRFAMELNEMEPTMREVLPHTDTRFRPDQRALEEGAVEAAEGFKHELEQAQRERRRENLPHRPAWFRKTLEDGEETWVFSGEYWKAREAGFSEHDVPRIW